MMELLTDAIEVKNKRKRICAIFVGDSTDERKSKLVRTGNSGGM